MRFMHCTYLSIQIMALLGQVKQYKPNDVTFFRSHCFGLSKANSPHKAVTATWTLVTTPSLALVKFTSIEPLADEELFENEAQQPS